MKWLGRGVLATSGLVLGSWLLVALTHIRDNYNVDHVAGTWIALARHVNQGTLYPRLFDGTAFGGTRYMPLQFVLHAGVARLTGEYLVSGKLLAYACSVAVYTLLFVICRNACGSSVLAIGLVAAVLGTGAGWGDSTSLRGDMLPVALQLGALYAVTRRSASPSVRSLSLAGLLCALAFLSKTTAVWAAIALAAWLAVRDRRRLPTFLLSLGGCTLALLAAFEVASDGRMSQNVFGLAGAGGYASVGDTLTKFVDLGQQAASTLWVLAPIATAAVGVGIARRRSSVYQVSLLVAAAILLPVLAAAGTYSNHLIDVEVLTAVVVAEAVREARPRAGAIAWALVATAVLWGTLTSFDVNVRPDVASAVHTLTGRTSGYHSGPLLAGTITEQDRILSEDPYVAVSHDEDPVVLDAFMLIQIARSHPDWEAAFVRQLASHRFTKIVLEVRDDPGDDWWRFHSFGPGIARAIARSYRLVETPSELPPGEHYFVYEPKLDT